MASSGFHVSMMLVVFIAFSVSVEADVSPMCYGPAGRDGRDGKPGRDGIQGPYGPPGPPGYAQSDMKYMMDSLLQPITEKLRDSLDRLETIEKFCQAEVSQGISIGGAVYTRWGRNICPSFSKTLYSGVVAGSHFQQTGSGVNQLCLPLNPQWNHTVAGHQSGSYVYGTEFQLNYGNSGFLKDNSGGKSQHDHEVQCAVCHTPGRLSHVMIPARLECPTGWTLEYIGFLMAQHHTHNKSEYICVDQNPDAHPGTSANLDGNLLYITEAACGSLPCPPYVDGYELTCVVCTK